MYFLWKTYARSGVDYTRIVWEFGGRPEQLVFVGNLKTKEYSGILLSFGQIFVFTTEPDLYLQKVKEQKSKLAREREQTFTHL